MFSLRLRHEFNTEGDLFSFFFSLRHFVIHFVRYCFTGTGVGETSKSHIPIYFLYLSYIRLLSVSRAEDEFRDQVLLALFFTRRGYGTNIAITIFRPPSHCFGLLYFSVPTSNQPNGMPGIRRRRTFEESRDSSRF